VWFQGTACSCCSAERSNPELHQDCRRRRRELVCARVASAIRINRLRTTSDTGLSAPQRMMLYMCFRDVVTAGEIKLLRDDLYIAISIEKNGDGTMLANLET